MTMIRIGYEQTRIGTVESTPDGLVYHPDQGTEDELRAIVAGVRRRDQSDDEALRYVAARLNNGYSWAQDVEDEPLYWPDGRLNQDKARLMLARADASEGETDDESNRAE